MKVYTGFGDKGKTALFGGQVVRKNNMRVEAYGTLDELNSMIGVLRVRIIDDAIVEILDRIQNEIFILSAEIATPDENKRTAFKEKIESKHCKQLEAEMDSFSEQLPELKNFILPGGGEAAAFSHLARTVCRRVERQMISLQDTGEIRDELLVYINRLGDLFFVLGRYLNFREGIEDLPWSGLRP